MKMRNEGIKTSNDICKKMKNVSVIMCTYNGAKYLKEQLDSIINQTYPIYELIIQDDCSTDGTVSILEEYAQKYSFIHYRINEKNKGYNLFKFRKFNLQVLIYKCRKYVSYLPPC